MSIGPSLRTFLLADTAIAALVGTRMYPVQLPQGTSQASIRYQHISGQRPIASPSGPLKLSGPRVQIDAWAPTYAEAESLAELIKTRLNGYRGAMGATTVQGAFFSDERDGWEPESKLYFLSRDYFVWFQE